MCGLQTKDVAKYQSRRKVIYTGEFVDTSIDLNHAFLLKWQLKNEMKLALKGDHDIHESQDGEESITDRDKIIEMMDAFNNHNPKTLIEKIKNEVAFTFLGCFLDIYQFSSEGVPGRAAELATFYVENFLEEIDKIADASGNAEKKTKKTNSKIRDKS